MPAGVPKSVRAAQDDLSSYRPAIARGSSGRSFPQLQGVSRLSSHCWRKLAVARRHPATPRRVSQGFAVAAGPRSGSWPQGLKAVDDLFRQLVPDLLVAVILLVLRLQIG